MKDKSAERTSPIGRIEGMTAVRAVRNGLTSIIPVLIIGAFALILKEFPVDAYKEFISDFAGGFLVKLFGMVNSATFGVLSVYMTYSISRAYMKLKADPDAVAGGAAFASLISFFILAGANLEDFGTDCMGPKSMFLAIITGLGASALYLRITRLTRRRRHYLFTTGANREFNRMLSTMFPIAAVVIAVGVTNAVITRVFSVDSFRELLANAFNRLFSIGGSEAGFIKGFFFVLLSSVLWFFGIHGSDTLEGVMQTYFPNFAAGETASGTILTKEFFDCFVLMGGCGAAICLLIAISIFSKNRARRRLGITAAFPMIFNINELMIFGLPVIFNPDLLVPFLLVPLACYTTSYLAISSGLVPYIAKSVEWTTPVILGGYTATGSIAGSLLQLFNIALGVAIYTPFVRMLDRKSEYGARREFAEFMDFFRANEQELAGTRITERSDMYGDFAKGLVVELRHDLMNRMRLYYQPQYHFDGHCVGVEALLRFEHPVHGMLYPPLVVKLAEEGGFLPELEEEIMSRALADRPRLTERFGEGIRLSFNVTGTTVVTQRYLDFCRKLAAKEPFAGKNVCIEVTEQAAISFNEETLGVLRALKALGLLLAIDDFSMGQTSIHYLTDNMFDEIKLDGSLIRGMFERQNNLEIVSSLVRLADSLELTVVAEYVETAEQRDLLHEFGCDCYQGYLYSAAVPLDADKK